MSSHPVCPACQLSQVFRLSINLDIDAVQYYRCELCGCVFVINTERPELAAVIVAKPAPRKRKPEAS
jgi:transposase-like protein